MSARKADPRGGGAIAALLLLVTILWPLQELSGGMLARNGHHLAQVVAFRYVSHLLLLLALVLPFRGVKALRTGRPGLQLLRGVCMFGMPAGYILAASFTSNAWIWTVFWFVPVGIVAGARLFLGERAPVAAWWAVALGALGATAVMRAGVGGLEGTGFALLMGGSFGGYVLLSRVLRGEALAASLFYTAVGALTPMVPFVWTVFRPVTWADVVPALVTGVLSLLILGILDSVAETEPAWRTAVVLPLVVLWELLVALILRGPEPGTGGLVGVVIILVSAFLAGRLLLSGRDPGEAPPRAAPSTVVDLRNG